MSDSRVYISDKVHGWIPATIISQNHENQQVTVKLQPQHHLGTDQDDHSAQVSLANEERTVSLKDYPINQLPLQNVDASGHLMEMPDMVDLPSLHEVRLE